MPSAPADWSIPLPRGSIALMPLHLIERARAGLPPNVIVGVDHVAPDMYV
jgi:hypothetical protein